MAEGKEKGEVLAILEVADEDEIGLRLDAFDNLE